MLYELYVQVEAEKFELEGVFTDTEEIVKYAGISKRTINFIINAEYDKVPKTAQHYAIIEVRDSKEWSEDIAEWHNSNSEVDETVLN